MRARLFAATAARAPAPPPAATPRPAPPAGRAAAGVRVRYLGQMAVRVIGPATGRPYVASATAPVLLVAAADAQGLVATASFRYV